MLSALHTPQTNRFRYSSFLTLIKRTWKTIRLAIVFVPLIQILLILWLIWTRTLAVPWWDEWATVQLVHKAKNGGLELGDLWAFHGEHRIVIPRFLNLVLILLTDWNRQVLMTFNFGVVLGSALLLLRCAQRPFQSKNITLALVLPFSLLLFSLSHYENWLWPFQITFIATILGVTCCVFGLAVQPIGPRGFSIAVFGALLASLSSLGGLMAWLAFVPVVWIMGYRWRWLGLWVGIGLAVIVPYLSNFPESNVTRSLSGRQIAYSLAYLGAPIVHPYALGSMWIGYFGLCLMVLNVLIYWRLHKDLRPISPWIGLALFALACAALTSFGRGQFPSRYHLFAALWWVALVVIGWHTIDQITKALPAHTKARFGSLQRRVLALNTSGFACVCLCLVRINLISFGEAQEWQAAERQNQACVVDYEHAPDSCLELFYPTPSCVRMNAANLEMIGMGPLFNGTSGLQPFQDYFAKYPATVPYSIERIAGVNVERAARTTITIARGSPVSVEGWAVDSLARSVAGTVLLEVDDEQIFNTNYGGSRHDVALSLCHNSYTNSGFAVTIPAGTLAPGKHVLAIAVVSKDGNVLYRSHQRVELEIMQ